MSRSRNRSRYDYDDAVEYVENFKSRRQKKIAKRFEHENVGNDNIEEEENNAEWKHIDAIL